MAERGVSPSVVNQENFGIAEWIEEASHWNSDSLQVVQFVALLDDDAREEVLERSLTAKAKDKESERKLQHMVDLLSLSQPALIKLLAATEMLNID